MFKASKNCLYYDRILKDKCYFEVELLDQAALLQIGFVHKDDMERLCTFEEGKGRINFDLYGASVKTDGAVVVYGVNAANFKTNFEYGDTIGIGLTQHDHSRRIWITKNGLLLNPAGQDETMKQIKITEEDTKGVEGVPKKAKKKEESPEQKQRKQKLAEKRKVELKTSKKFRYYAVVVSEGGFELG